MTRRTRRLTGSPRLRAPRSPESAPLELFGPDTARDVGDLLDAAGITLRTNTRAEVPTGNLVELHPQGEHIPVDRVVTLPILTGPKVDGLPHDDAGFLPVDPHGRVMGTPGVYAAGDATDFDIKQGGIACQQAEAAAEAIAADAGVAIDPTPFVPVLRGLLLTEHDTRWMQRTLGRQGGAEPDYWPQTKFAGRELAPLLGDFPVRPS